MSRLFFFMDCVCLRLVLLDSLWDAVVREDLDAVGVEKISPAGNALTLSSVTLFILLA